jgi:hypothetical protein
VFRRLRDLVAALAVLVVVLGILALINPRMRETVGQVTSGVQNQGWSETSAPIETAAHGVVSITSGYAVDNPFLFSFMVAAVVMFLLMVRT